MATQMRSGRNTPGNPLQQAAMLVIPFLLFQRAERNCHPIRRLRSYLAVSLRRRNRRRQLWRNAVRFIQRRLRQVGEGHHIPTRPCGSNETLQVRL
jgi:hypothetical protein